MANERKNRKALEAKKALKLNNLKVKVLTEEESYAELLRELALNKKKEQARMKEYRNLLKIEKELKATSKVLNKTNLKTHTYDFDYYSGSADTLKVLTHKVKSYIAIKGMYGDLVRVVSQRHDFQFGWRIGFQGGIYFELAGNPELGPRYDHMTAEGRQMVRTITAGIDIDDGT